MGNQLALTHYLATFIEGLVRAGVEDVVISPGSRSTPIAILMEEHPTIKTWMNIDERSAAFFALGIAKASRKPVALLCTSGTAAANYFPAIVEATHSRVPLIVLTADRPHELRDVGAPQAINQIELYGKYSKWFVEMALPESTTNILHYAYSVATRAVSTSLSSPAGVVHLNFPLREPLLPNLEELQWNLIGIEKAVYSHAKQSLPEELVPLIQEIQDKKKGIIICGPHDQEAFPDAVVSLAEVLGYPVIADPLSQVRSGTHSKECIIDCYDTILKSTKMFQAMKPEVIIRFGAMPVSKLLMQFISQSDVSHQFIIDQDEGWRDPTFTGTHFVHMNEIDFCHQVSKMVEAVPQARESEYLNKWKVANEVVKPILRSKLTDFHFEGDVVRHLVNLLDEDMSLFIGNSMPIRDIDTFFFAQDRRIRLFANRGANGIDGIISTALGISTRVKRVILLVGDLTFYHDLNGLLASKMHSLPITVVLVNNNGGGIFSFLPQAKEEKNFEQLFGTPVDLDYEKVVSMYDGQFSRVSSWGEFEEAVSISFNSKQLSVIEVPTTDRSQNVLLHRQLWDQAVQQLDGLQEI
ncbi:2-succinyl-5-enolpyruvyl-6-hydroxy-3-cyclohexene-1-carboxylate synthase [Bacillus mesophilus]|uniref:2-succinyl-5-enolpyruvyl-6-hydroxy-3-cyclohexene-1-carboxylate synthase n=1 Tax=Bacillus mesophilus TaxID=1808955 RepID=A0A6M0Q6N1_9BACI|nr:2-succinyl-5-enolpyruvyl-6-hydroxy-3-cyclohexene-1-carboxylic-acid synthase [Bacillus mesophilus]MBM7660427.1 2-succinyl-5-enolpyruvyl-6-hydroxy-3-cyclohexene-1-carboxylate synthase [Bacillus mesophilus]NEY72021.1 2-succinyl-5-enolpyruvyl-6-hydroxy-3-cyclohexene-1-carboxylic-acid synthase [Bacillus mesophilus]